MGWLIAAFVSIAGMVVTLGFIVFERVRDGWDNRRRNETKLSRLLGLFLCFSLSAVVFLLISVSRTSL